MTLQQLRYVVAVADSGTISGAAKRLFVTQPSLTKAVRELERELGMAVFRRSSRGVVATNEGDEFLGYARQVLQQEDLLEEKYLTGRPRKKSFSVSCQHYSFAVEAFVDLIEEFGGESYDFCLRETQTHQIVEDVSHLRSEVGIIYLSKENETILSRIVRQADLRFDELLVATPHVFLSAAHPLAGRRSVTLEDLDPYPYLCYEQGDSNSFYFSEEVLSSLDHARKIRVADRATLFNLAVGLNGYTTSTGIISRDLNGENIVSVPLDVDEVIRVGTLVRRDVAPSELAGAYLRALGRHI